MVESRQKLNAQRTAQSDSGFARVTSHPALICLLLAAITLAVYWPVKGYDFVNFDDSEYFTSNAHVLGGLTWANFVWAWTSLSAGFWQPLTWLSLMLDVTLFGDKAGGPHLTNALLHVANTVALFLVLRRLTGTNWRSAIVAALFALHPLHVESVAWVSERKDVLSTFWGILSLMFYGRYAEAKIRNPKSEIRNFVLALFFFACSLMSKSMLVTLPLILLLLDWWPLKRFAICDLRFAISKLVREKLPFFGLSFIATIVTVFAEKKAGAIFFENQISAAGRIANAFLSYVRYLAQMFWPDNLAVFYPWPKSFAPWLVTGAVVLLLVISAIALWLGRRRPYLAVGWFWYLITLLPVIGFIQLGRHAHADRFTYVPLIGVFLILVWGACEALARWRAAKSQVVFITSLVLVACAFQTRNQLGYWQNSETLLRHTLAVTKDNSVAYENLGNYLSDEGRMDDAIAIFRQALQNNPTHPGMNNALGVRLMMKGDVDEAIVHFQEAIRSDPKNPSAHNNLGVALATQRKFAEAIPHYVETLRLAPDYVAAHDNLGYALAHLDRNAEAIPHFTEALRLKPDFAQAHFHLGYSLAKVGRRDEAVKEFKEALRLQPGYAEAQQNLRALGVSVE